MLSLHEIFQLLTWKEALLIIANIVIIVLLNDAGTIKRKVQRRKRS